LISGTHADQVAVARQHLRDLGHVLLGIAVHHRVRLEFDAPGILARRQHDRVRAQLPGADLERAARAHRRIEEQQRDRAPLEIASKWRLLQARSLVEQRIEFGATQVLGVQEVADHGFSWTKTTKPGTRPGFVKKTECRPDQSDRRRAREVMPEA
jgi:hypothetical protein